LCESFTGREDTLESVAATRSGGFQAAELTIAGDLEIAAPC